MEGKDHARSNKMNLGDNSIFHELKDKYHVPIQSFFVKTVRPEIPQWSLMD